MQIFSTFFSSVILVSTCTTPAHATAFSLSSSKKQYCMLGCSLAARIVLVKWEVKGICRFCKTEKYLMPVIFG